jgi:hypothetical protein
LERDGRTVRQAIEPNVNRSEEGDKKKENDDDSEKE